MAYIGRQNLGGAYRQLDDISSGFDGSDTTHTMQVNSANVTVGDVNQIILSLGGVIQKPGTDFTVSGSVLTFTTAPAANTSFFAILLGSDNGGTVTPTDASVTDAKLASTISSINNTGGNLVVDISNEIHLDSDDGVVRFKDGGTEIGSVANSSSDMVIAAAVSDKDIKFNGNDGGSGITAWTMDMSAGGHLIPGNAATGIYLGVNSATDSNLLHDYEEGTWTPHLESNTNDEVDNYDSRSGVYTKVGRLVTLHCYIDAGTKGTVGGDYVRIGNFPFTPEDTNSITFTAATIGYWQNFDINDSQLMASTYTSNAFAYLFKTSTDNGYSQVTTSDLIDNARVAMTATYTVAT